MSNQRFNVRFNDLRQEASDPQESPDPPMARQLAGRRAKPAAPDEAERKAARLRFYGDEFVFDTVSGFFYRVSPSAAFMLRSFSRGASASELTDALCARYGIDRATAARDVELFMNDVASLDPLAEWRL
jgi:hypothetical protein